MDFIPTRWYAGPYGVVLLVPDRLWARCEAIGLEQLDSPGHRYFITGIGAEAGLAIMEKKTEE